MVRVEGEFEDWELAVCGSDVEGHRAQLEREATELGLKRISFSGASYGEGKSKLYRSAQLYVLPSYTENYAMTVAESLAEGTPVLTTTGTPWSLLREKGCGWVCEADASSLESALRRALALPLSELRAMGERGRRWMREDFSWRESPEWWRTPIAGSVARGGSRVASGVEPGLEEEMASKLDLTVVILTLQRGGQHRGLSRLGPSLRFRGVRGGLLQLGPDRRDRARLRGSEGLDRAALLRGLCLAVELGPEGPAGPHAVDHEAGWDERVSPALSAELETALSSADREVVGFYLRFYLVFLGKTLKWGGLGSNYLLRIWRTGAGFFEDREVNEHAQVEAEPSGSVATSNIGTRSPSRTGWTGITAIPRWRPD